MPRRVGLLELFVLDTGNWAEPEMCTKVFDVFVQAEPAKERAQGGLGIGLALVKALVEGCTEAKSMYKALGATRAVSSP